MVLETQLFPNWFLVNPKHLISLTNLQKTLLITLYAKALESKHEDSILQDRYAAEIVPHIDFDFTNFRLSHNAIVAVAIRAKALDQWTANFLAENQQANVIHVGCGLDSRYQRLCPPDGVSWWEVDYPEVIELRKKTHRPQLGCHLIGADILEDDWFQAIPTDVPTIVVAEGVLPYFSQEAATHFLASIVAHFDTGQVAFDAYNHWGVKWLNQLPIMRQTQETLHWAIDDPKQLESLVPGMCLSVENTDGLPEFVHHVGFWARSAFRFSRSLAPLRRMGQLLLYDFGPV